MKQPTIEELETRLDQFRKELDELKQSPEVLEDNCWYVYAHGTKLACFKTGDKNNYGFNTVGNWRNNIDCFNPLNWRKATESDLLPLFTKEAERRYKMGDKIRRQETWGWAFSGDTIIGKHDATSFDLERNLFQYKDVCVYQNGVWAEVIKSEPITVGGFEVKYYHNNVIINGKVIWKAFLETQAKEYAVRCHEETNHKYNDHPYSVHLGMVRDVAERFIYLIPEEDRDLVYSSCWTHDLIEDCRQTYNDVMDATNREVAELTYALTNEKGKNRKARANDKYYSEIRLVKHAVFVKACDRIANFEYSISTKSRMSEMYAKENQVFCQSLYSLAYSDLFTHLRELSNNILNQK